MYVCICIYIHVLCICSYILCVCIYTVYIYIYCVHRLHIHIYIYIYIWTVYIYCVQVNVFIYTVNQLVILKDWGTTIDQNMFFAVPMAIFKWCQVGATWQEPIGNTQRCQIILPYKWRFPEMGVPLNHYKHL